MGKRQSILQYEYKLKRIITFMINKGYYLELLTLERMKIFRSTKSKITKNKNGENIFNLEI